MKLTSYNYQPEVIQTGILHIGVGNFHQAHQQYFVNRLLADPDQQTWGICGICLLPADQKIVENLRSQDLKYTLTVCGRDGKDEVFEIGSLKESAN
jgi:mannitol 2-dehydrogenase